MDPITTNPDPIHGAILEIISAMSSLNMEPEALPANTAGKIPGKDIIYLSESDRWAAHAMRHLDAALEYLRKAQHYKRSIENALALFDTRMEMTKTILRSALQQDKGTEKERA